MQGFSGECLAIFFNLGRQMLVFYARCLLHVKGGGRETCLA